MPSYLRMLVWLNCSAFVSTLLQHLRTISKTSDWSWTMMKSHPVLKRSLLSGRRCLQLPTGQRSKWTWRSSTPLWHRVKIYLHQYTGAESTSIINNCQQKMKKSFTCESSSLSSPLLSSVKCNYINTVCWQLRFFILISTHFDYLR